MNISVRRIIFSLPVSQFAQVSNRFTHRTPFENVAMALTDMRFYSLDGTVNLSIVGFSL